MPQIPSHQDLCHDISYTCHISNSCTSGLNPLIKVQANSPKVNKVKVKSLLHPQMLPTHVRGHSIPTKKGSGLSSWALAPTQCT